MTKSTLVLAIRAALAGSAMLGAAIPAALAQETRNDQRQVVTGSHLELDSVGNAAALKVVTRHDIERSGLISLGDLLQELPSAGSTLNSRFNSGGNGETWFDLGNLGATRTLVLFNGRRLTPNLQHAIDLNNVPLAVVERIEILREGASALYGADAVAGVVNIVTRSGFQGIEANAQMGQFDDDDGETQSFDISVGTASDRGSMFFNVGYLKQESVMAGDRAISMEPQFGTGVAFGSSTTPQGRFFGFFTNLTFQTTDTGANVNPAGCSNGICPGGDGADAFREYDAGQDAYNFSPSTYLVTPFDRTHVYAEGRYQLSDSVGLNSEMTYVKQDSRRQNAPPFLIFGGLLGSFRATDFGVGAGNPFNPFGIDLHDSSTVFQRRLVEAGPQQIQRDVDSFRFVLAMDGEFTWASRDFSWEIGSVYGQIDRSEIVFGDLNLDRVHQALSSDCPNTPGCVPLNIFGGLGPDGLGTITEPMLAFIEFEGHNEREMRMRNYDARLSGTITELPGGPLAFSAGLSYHQVEGFDKPDALAQSGVSFAGPDLTTEGRQATDSVYLELAVPLLANRGMVERLDLGLAARHSDAETFGHFNSLKLALDWQVTDDLSIRATASDDFRAPSLSQQYLEQTDTFPTINDICSDLAGIFGNPPAPPDVVEGCVASGVPADGSYVFLNVQTRVPTGGNPNLRAEESESWTLGAFYRPDADDGLSVGLQYQDLEIDDTIATLGAQFILETCVFTGQLCDRVERNRGFLVFIDNTLANFGQQRFEGLDLDARFGFAERDWGRLSLVWQSSYQSRNARTVYRFSDSSLNEFLGISSGDEAYPRWRARLATAWSRGDWEVGYSLNYIHGTREFCGDFANDPAFAVVYCTEDSDGDGEVDRRSLGSTTYHDLQLAYHLSAYDARLVAGVRNLFDKGPPLSLDDSANSYNRGAYRAPGRFPYLKLTVDF